MQFILKVWAGAPTFTVNGEVITVTDDPLTLDDASELCIASDADFRVLVQNTDASGSGKIHASCDRGSHNLNPAAEAILGSSVVLEGKTGTVRKVT